MKFMTGRQITSIRSGRRTLKAAIDQTLPLSSLFQNNKKALRNIPQSLSSKLKFLLYVPCAQEVRYLFCSGVRVSILMPMEPSFSFATQFSTSVGTS
jgi:hypothetical protein